EQQLAVEVEARDGVVHPVEAADEGALAAAGRADHGGDQVLLDLDVDVLDGHVGAVAHRQPRDVEDGFADGCLGSLACRDVDGPHRRHGNGLAHVSLLGHWPSFLRLRASAARASRLVTSTNASSTSAVAQARLWSSGSADSDQMKIWTGMFGRALRGFVWMLFRWMDVVKSSGAVSPAARAIASTVPVRIPPSELGSTTPITTRQRLAPTASAPPRWDRVTKPHGLWGERGSS